MTGAANDVDSLLGEHVPGLDGYRFGAAVEHGLGDAVRIQILDGHGHEVGWAVGFTKHELIRDAMQKTQGHETRHAI